MTRDAGVFRRVDTHLAGNFRHRCGAVRCDAVRSGGPAAVRPAFGARQPYGDPVMRAAGVRPLRLRAPHPRAVGGGTRNSGFRLRGAQVGRYTAERRSGARPVGPGPPERRPAGGAGRVLREDPAGTVRRTGGAGRRPLPARSARTLRIPVRPLPIPARPLSWHRVAQTTYASLPPYVHESCARSVRSPRAVARRPSPAGAVPRRVPARPRRRRPPKHIIRAVSRIGPGSRPAPYKVRP